MTSSEDADDRARFERLYVELRVGILGYLARRAASMPDAADMVAETFLIAWRRIDDVPSDGTARLWLYGVARHVLANHHRHQRVEKQLAETLRADLRRDCANARRQQLDSAGEAIAAALATLRPADREIMELSAWEGLTPSEIAGVLGAKPGAVRVRLHRIRSLLRTELIEAGFTRPDQMECTG